MRELVLYYSVTCGFCQKVLRYIEKNNITLTLKNITQSSQIREELVRVGGKSQVPCLMIDGKPLYESNDIIRWLQDHLSAL